MALSSAEKEQAKSKANPLIALLNLQPETVWPDEAGGEQQEEEEEEDKGKQEKEVIVYEQTNHRCSRWWYSRLYSLYMSNCVFPFLGNMPLYSF